MCKSLLVKSTKSQSHSPSTVPYWLKKKVSYSLDTKYNMFSRCLRFSAVATWRYTSYCIQFGFRTIKSKNSWENAMNNRVTDKVWKMFLYFTKNKIYQNIGLRTNIFIEFYLYERTICVAQHDKNEILG